MSKIGKLPIKLPSGVKVAVQGAAVQIEGPKGKMSYKLARGVTATVNGDVVVVAPEKDSQEIRAAWGAARAHINNMVLGVSAGWKKTLEMQGVGFQAKVQGANLVLSVGFSHDVELPIPQGMKCAVQKNTIIELESSDKDSIGSFAAKVRDVQPPEPYLGKGVRYQGEAVRRKAGKAGKK